MSGQTGSNVPSLPAAGALSGAELLYLVQSGTDKKLSLTALGVFTGAGYLPLTGGTVSGALTVSGTLTGNGAVTLSPASGAVTINPTSAGAIDNMSIGVTTAAAAKHTTIAASGQITSTVTTGTAPLVIASTTNVANLNASSLAGATFAAPGPVGSGAASTGAFTTLSASSTVSGAGFDAYLALGTKPASFTTLAASSTVSGAGFDAYIALGTKPASFTTLAASSTVSGAGFTARFATPGPIGNTSASTGQFTTLAASSTITPSSTAGIVGTTTNDSANAGSVGEFISSTVLSGSAVSLSNNTAANVTSISLTAGDWDVRGNVAFLANAATVTTYLQGWTSSSSAATPTDPNNGANAYTFVNTTGINLPNLTIGTQRFSLSGTTTVFLEAKSVFSTNTNAAYGFIGARRVR